MVLLDVVPSYSRQWNILA